MSAIGTKFRPLARSCVLGLATLCLGFAAQSAVADTGFDDVKTATVSYADLDLSKPAGAATLYRRLKAAARMVCSPYDSRITRKSWRECYDNAISDAVAEINRPTLAALHAEKGKRTARG